MLEGAALIVFTSGSSGMPKGAVLSHRAFAGKLVAIQSLLGFASIPAFIIPLTVAGETVKLAYAGMGYALLTALSNVTDMFEGVVGAGLYWLFTQPWLAWLIAAFRGSFLDIASSADERTLVLEMFVYIGLAFTLLTIPFLELLKRELERRSITIRLGRAEG